MKVAIPVEDKSMEARISQSFARSTYYLIYNSELNENVFLANKAATSQGGAGIKAAQFIVDNNVDILLTPQCGENAADILKAADVKIYKTINDSIKVNIDALEKGSLKVLDDIHKGHHGHREN